MKHELGSTIFYLQKNKIMSGQVLATMTIENLNNEWPHKNDVIGCVGSSIIKAFGADEIFYSTKHGEFSEYDVFESPEILVDNLLKKV